MPFELPYEPREPAPRMSLNRGRRVLFPRLRGARADRDRARLVAVALLQQNAELAGALKRVLTVCDHAAKVSPSPRMTVYVADVLDAVGLVEL